MSKLQSDADEVIKEYIRKNLIKFYVNIYRMSTTKNLDDKYMCDICYF